MGFKIITQPKMNQNLGPWVKPANGKYCKALAYEKDVLQALANGIPPFHYYAQSWHYQRVNWLPFYWLGFKQTTRYTYVIDNRGVEECVWRDFQENIRTDVRKARERLGIVVRPAQNIFEILDAVEKTFIRQGKRSPYTGEVIERLDASASSRNARDMIVAEGPGGVVHAAAYIVRDADTAYYLMGGGDPELRSSGATSLCLWEAIRMQPEHIKRFDFEGSMIEPIERFFRAFGARQVPYFRVTKCSSRLLGLAMALNTVWKGH